MQTAMIITSPPTTPTSAASAVARGSNSAAGPALAASPTSPLMSPSTGAGVLEITVVEARNLGTTQSPQRPCTRAVPVAPPTRGARVCSRRPRR